MAYRYPYDEELRKTPLNADMIRHQIHQDAGRTLLSRCLVGIPLALICGGTLALLLTSYSWDSGTPALILGIINASLLAFSVVIGIGVCINALVNYSRAFRGETVIEIDTVSYIEHDRPRMTYRKRIGPDARVVYEDFLHFGSGREFKDEEQTYRHKDIDGEKFITVAYTADRKTILRIYRLSDYNWQE